MSDVTPADAATGHLRASDTDREQVATVLSTAFAEGRLTREEHDERLSRVLAARTFEDLVPLTSDLVPHPGATRGVAVSPGKPYVVQPAAPTADDTETLVAVFGGSQRAERWRVKRRLRTYAVFGGVDLDMRQAVFESPEVEVSGFWVFGGMDVKVPEGVEVRNHVVGVFGGTDVKGVGERDPEAPVLVVRGLALFGGLSVTGPHARRKRHGHASCS